MGKNTQERQDFIIDNLRVEKDAAEETVAESASDELDIAS
jgi:topoisomerase-4 subunit B